MDFQPSENSLVINPITGSTMVGKYIQRDLSKNRLNPDEMANANRMRIHVKSLSRFNNLNSYESQNFESEVGELSCVLRNLTLFLEHYIIFTQKSNSSESIKARFGKWIKIRVRS